LAFPPYHKYTREAAKIPEANSQTPSRKSATRKMFSCHWQSRNYIFQFLVGRLGDNKPQEFPWVKATPSKLRLSARTSQKSTYSGEELAAVADTGIQ
jgi:hypothetical protein